MARQVLASLALSLVLGAASGARADTVTLANGDKLTGEIVYLVDNKLTFKTAYAGDIVIDWTQVVAVTSDKPLPVILKDQSALVGKVVPQDGKMATELAIGTSPPYTTVDVAAINPPPPPPAFKYKGGLSMSGRITDGNANTKSASARGEVETKVERQRLSLRGGWDYTETEGELSQRRAFGAIKLDYFFTKKLYAFVQASFEGDKFKDLDLRSTFGAGLGFQWIDDETLKYYTEAGLSYVVEDRRRGEDQQTLSARAAHKFDWTIVAPNRLVFFHFGEIYPSVEDLDDFFAHTETGLRVGILDGLGAVFQVDFDYDNTPAPGRGRRDTAYLVGIGYTFGN
jgi:putative salt-induced outer membrane protein YdiY